MKIILLKDVKSIGKKDEIKEVKDGYGKFLITKKDAVLYSNKSLEILNSQKSKKENELAKNIQECEIIKKKIENIKLSFVLNEGKNKKLFGIVTPKMIAEELYNNKIEIDKKKIDIKGQLNTLGIHEVKINLHKSVIAKLYVEIKSQE